MLLLNAYRAASPGPDRGKACILDMGQFTTLNEGESREPPTEVLAFPSGVIKTTKGNFLLDSEAVKATMTDWKDWSGGITHKGVFDYNHDMANPDLPGYLKIAAGWFDLEARDTGLWAVNVTWTERCTAMIRAGEMRFWSPWFEYQTKTGRILKLMNIAVTCMPATKAQAPMVAATLCGAPPLDDEEEIRSAQMTAIAAEELAGRNLAERPRPSAPPTATTAASSAPTPSAPPAQPARRAAAAWTHHVITAQTRARGR